jgi:hypothetical protein
MHIDGQCHWGRVTFDAGIDPSKVSICHCTDSSRGSHSPARDQLKPIRQIWCHSAAPWINDLRALSGLPAE